jgi:glycolate oxidase iron-sulfur subunit
MLRIHQKLGLQWLIGQAPVLPTAVRRLNNLLPMVQIGSPAPRRPATERRGVVNLFRGCAGSLFDQQTLDASQRLLEGLGYQVKVPAGQGCCGALHQHNGDPATAALLADRNRTSFAVNNDPILPTASGCTAHLRDYQHLYENKPADGFTERVNDILHFLRRQARPEVQFQPFDETVAVHIPCTHRNVLKQHQDILDILGWIPGIEPHVINPNGGCCGAAGSYMLTQPALSERLRAPLIDTLVHSGATTLLTTNIGCAIQLQAGLKEHAVAIEVLHPVVLLERLLQRPSRALW